MDALLQDLRYALRGLARAPGFALAAIVTLALAIGVNATVFGAANAFVLRPADARDPGRLVRVHLGTHSPLSYDQYRYLRERSRAFSSVIAARNATVAMGTEQGNERIYGALVSGDYFTTLGIGAALGRTLVAADDAPGAAPVVVLSHAFWTSRFGADPAVVGRAVRLSGRPYQVVGVARAGFNGPSPGFAPNFWTGFSQAQPLTGWNPADGGSSVYTFARLRPGLSRATAQAEADLRARELTRLDPALRRPIQLSVHDARGLETELRSVAAAFSAMLLAVVAGVLLIACANIANLLLARAVARRREIGIRLALGAGQGRLVRQLLTESVMLALAGGAAGLALAFGGAAMLQRMVPDIEPVAVDFSPDVRVLVFTLVLSLGAAVLCGLAPARRAAAPDVMDALRPGAPALTRTRGRLVLVQSALCTVLLGGALLCLRSLAHAGMVDPGFSQDGVLDLTADVGLGGYDRQRGEAYFARLVEAAEALPGVRSAAVAAVVPLGGSNMETRFSLAGQPEDEGSSTYFNVVGPKYFTTLAIPLVSGRELAAGETDGVVVNRTLAERTWPGGRALGQQISFDGRPWTVVGIARDANYVSLGEAPKPTLYLPFAGAYQDEMTVHVRTSGDPAALRRALAAAAEALDPTLPLAEPRTLREDTRISLLQARMGAGLLGTFGALALILAAVGIYGVVSFTVAQRTREIGIRAALGATRAALLALVVRGGVRPVAVGTAIGLVLAVGLARAARTMLFGVGALDPVLLGGAPAVLLSTAVLASLVPARRAARVDPLEALRAE